VDESEQKAIADLLRTVRIGVIVCAVIMSGAGANELMGMI
jgi:hypothetical protein